jgi:hypothetical protein
MRVLSASVSVLVLALLLVPSAAFAQNDEYYKKQVQRRVEENEGTKALAQSYNFRSLDTKTGYIFKNQNTFQDAVFDLKVGFIYVFVASCDEDCTDIDIELLDPDGRQLMADTKNRFPVVHVFPDGDGKYTIRARITSCGGFVGCYWAVHQMGK